MTTTITQRVGSSASSSTTKRVATSGASPAVGGGNGGDTWARTWGNTWGRTWYDFTAASGGTDASPTVDVTRRIGSAPTANNTKRVTL